MEATILERYEDPVAFSAFATAIGLNATQYNKLVQDGFNSMKDLVDHHLVFGPKALEKYLQDVNKTFATASTVALRVYFNPILVNRLAEFLNYYMHTVHSLHTISDILDINVDIATNFATQ